MSLLDRLVQPPPVTAQSLGPIKTWAYSSLKRFEECAYRTRIRYVDKVKEPQVENSAADRGTALHKTMEDFVTGESDLLPTKTMKDDSQVEVMRRRRERYAAGKVEVETQWGFTIDWTPTDWWADDVWGRFSLDLLEYESETSIYVEDYKSGKSFGNELKHAEQLMFYAVAGFQYLPQIEHVTARINYIDEGKLGAPKHFTRAQALVFLPRIDARAKRMTTATKFPPNPSKHNCKFCPYKTMQRDDGTFVCEWGVLE